MLEKYKGLLYLAGLVIVVPYLVFSLAISDNVRMGRETKKIERETEALKAKAGQSGSSAVNIINRSDLTRDAISDIMGMVGSARCNVVKYTPYITESRDGLTVHTNELTVSGRYSDLLKLTAAVENGLPGLRLVSTSFRTVRQRQKKEVQLHMTLILQQITSM